MSYFCKTAVVLCLILFGGINLFAQLALKNTNWSSNYQISAEGKVNLQFGDDKLMVINTNKTETISVMSFEQRQNTLIISSTSGKNSCETETGLYQITYQNSGQILSLAAIQDLCGYRKNLFVNSQTFSFVPDENSAPRDWLQSDAEKGLIAGINLSKAYELLKGRPSKTVIVAVIDNGVEIDHEDLKNSIWTNTKEIPGNGIDDDHNGYVDDIHGWNFRGTKDGTIIENEQSGATQIYAAWKNKYDNAIFRRLSVNERKEFDIYTKAKKAYLEKLSESKDSNDLKFAYNVKYDSSELIKGDSKNINARYYGSPLIKLSPNLSHGTHVAGIIAAERNNQIGIDGIADNVLIMPIVASTAVGDERDKDVANAIRYAVNNGAKVINISFSKTFSPYKKQVDEAIRYAEKNKILIVHCAGNDGVDVDSAENYHYPVAIYENGRKAANFITVGWSRPLFNYRLAHPSSGYGKKNVDLFAPGSDIFSTVPNNGYDFKSGSSMSVPCVSGVVALLLSYFPTLSTAQVREIILRTSFKPNIMVNRPGSKVEVPFSSLSATGGIVNANNAVKMAISISEKK
ncbi:MAG: S8 family peptidase [Actinomycetota bacterium]